VTATYFLPEAAGSHDFKVGFEWLDDQSKFANNGSSGPVFYRDLNGAIDQIRLTDLGDFGEFGTGWTGADDRNERFAAFLQDRWSLSRNFTLSLGLRFDRQQPYYMDAVRDPVLSNVFPPTTVSGQTLLTSSKIVPRLGVSYTPVADGKSVIKAFYGRYYFNFADRFSGLNPGGTNTRDYRFNDLNGNRLYDGPQELGALVASAGGTSTSLAPDLKTPYADEVSVSFERQFWEESSIRAAYVRKMTRDEFATYNILREGQFTVPRQVTINEQDFVNGVTGPITLTVFDIPDSLRGQVQNVVANIPESVGGGDYNYDTVQVAFNKRFSYGLFLQSSFDYQWRDELRTTTGPAPSTSPLNSDPISPGYFQNVFPEVSNRQDNSNWQARVLGRYVFPFQIGLGVNWRAQSGWQYARLLRVVLPNAGTQTFFAENIENNRSDMVSLLDFRVDKAFTFGGKYRFTVMAELFNSMNTNAVSNFNLLNGSQYDRIIATLDPRTFQLGFRFDF
jgi:hypothetical protein